VKRAILASIILLGLILLAAVSLRPLALFIAKKAIGNIFADSTVSISGCTVNPLRQISFADIQIQKGQAYNFKIKELKINYDLNLIKKLTVNKVSLAGVEAGIDLGQKKIADFGEYLNLKGRSPFLIGRLELAGIKIDLKSADLNLRGEVSLELSLAKQTLDYLEVRFDNFSMAGVSLDNFSFAAAQSKKSGRLYIRQVSYDKLRISNIQSQAVLEGTIVSLDGLSAELFSGKISGDFTAQLGEELAYTLNLQAAGLSLEALVQDFNLMEKFQLSGRLNGKVTLQGQGPGVRILKGNFFAADPGGTLEIKDKQLLEAMAKNTGQSLEMVVESFKDYHYNKGDMRLGLEGSNLVFDMQLDGTQGKRNINIILHDFQLWRWAQ
jgi:hypothetical protein